MHRHEFDFFAMIWRLEERKSESSVAPYYYFDYLISSVTVWALPRSILIRVGIDHVRSSIYVAQPTSDSQSSAVLPSHPTVTSSMMGSADGPTAQTTTRRTQTQEDSRQLHMYHAERQLGCHSLGTCGDATRPQLMPALLRPFI
jgi:hypothetical protein